MLRQQGNGANSSAVSLRASFNSRNSSNAGRQSGWRQDDPEDLVREGRTSLAATSKSSIEAVTRSNGRLLSLSSSTDLARAEEDAGSNSTTTSTQLQHAEIGHASSQSLIVDPACNEFAFLDTGSLHHSRPNANLAGDVLRTRASLNPETAQLRSRTTSRSNISNRCQPYRSFSTDPLQNNESATVETVAGKIAAEHVSQQPQASFSSMATATTISSTAAAATVAASTSAAAAAAAAAASSTSSSSGLSAAAAAAAAAGGKGGGGGGAGVSTTHGTHTTAFQGRLAADSRSSAAACGTFATVTATDPSGTARTAGSQPARNDQVTVEISRKTREQRRKEIKKEFEKWDPAEKSGCRWTFVFDPSGRLCYYWSLVVSIAFLYNFWVIIYRFSFSEITTETLPIWFTFDYMADFLYVLDIFFHFRTGYLDEGVLQTDGEKLRNHYLNSTMFYIDALCLLPLDFLYLSIHFNSILRGFRLVKIYRFWAFLDRTERHTNYPNVFRAINLTHYVLVIFHWNACISHIIDKNDVFGSGERWFNNSMCGNDTVCEYLHAFYWSTLSFTTVGDLPRPRTKGQYLFLIIQLVLGLFLFATVLGHVANIVTNVSAARKEFQAKLDAVKTYMRMRHVPDHLQNKVIRWFDYLWMTQKSSDEERSVGCLPDKLKAEIAIHVHLDTLKRVEIFQNTEAGFLCELVLRLRPVLFSPGDYICRKGEVGKEMYIVNRGKLQVVADDGKTVLATLRAGSYFGEISILNMGTAGNRRTASVRSVGYSDLFCLYKHDMWDVLKDYPAARVRLEAIAVKRLEKYKKEPIKKSRWLTPLTQVHLAHSYLTHPSGYSDGLPPTPNYPYARMHPLDRAARSRVYASEAGLGEELLELEKVAMGRSRSTPGLLESRGKKTLEDTPVQDDGVARSKLNKASSTCSSPSGQREGHVPTSSYLLEQRSTCCHSSLRTSPAPTTGRHASPATASAGLECHYPYSSSIVGRSSHPSATTAHAQQHYQPPPSPLPQYLNLPPGPPQHAGTTFTLQGPHAFIPIPTGTPVLASRSSPYTDYTNVSPVSSSNEPTTVAPPTALYGTSPGNSSTATGTGQTHLFVPSPLQTSGIHSGAHSPTATASASRDQEDLLNEIKRLRERLVTLETENATMSIKLSQSTWKVENRLAEIEMHISTKNQHQYSPQQRRTECPTDSEFASGSDSDERNKESII